MTLKRKELALNALSRAKKALDKEECAQAKKYALQASRLNPTLEEAWLILAAVSEPQESLSYLKKVLDINPKSRKAREGIRWANQSLRKAQPDKDNQETTKKNLRHRKGLQGKKLAWEIPLFAGILLTGLLVLALISLPTFSAQAASQKSSRPEGALFKPTLTPTITPTQTATPTPHPTPTATPTPDTYYTSYTYHSWDIPDEVSGGSTFWIEIDLTNQTLYAYHGSQLINGFLISSGTSSYRTVTGTYKIYAKFPTYTMVGPGYHLEDVPYSMFFYKGYSIHGTYWHNNFGTPMSHGCVNMDTSDAAWVYDNAPVGTYVFVHY